MKHHETLIYQNYESLCYPAAYNLYKWSIF